MFYPTAFHLWGDEEQAAIARVLSSGRLTMGQEVAAFEAEFAAWHGRRYGIMVNSGSSANLVAVAALKHQHYRVFLSATVPALAWATTYAPLVQHHIDLELVDCDDTWNASNVDVACSVLGNPAYMTRPLIEDNCESLGAVAADGKLCGTFGVLSTFSFYWSHQISAVEGGMILTDDDELADGCRMLRDHGMVRGQGDFDDEYDFRLFGYNVRPVEMHAAIAREQLKKLPDMIAARLRNWRLFSELTSDLPLKTPRMVGHPSPFSLHFTVADNATRTRLAKALRSWGIDCRLPTGGSFRLHRYGAPWHDQQTPVADRIHQTGMFLGNAPFDISDKIEHAVAIMRRTLREEVK